MGRKETGAVSNGSVRPRRRGSARARPRHANAALKVRPTYPHQTHCGTEQPYHNPLKTTLHFYNSKVPPPPPHSCIAARIHRLYLKCDRDLFSSLGFILETVT